MRMLIGVYGASGCGRGIMPLVRTSNIDADILFIDDSLAPSSVNGHDIVNWDVFKSKKHVKKTVCIAIANPKVRRKIADLCGAHNIPIKEVRAPNVVEMDNVIIGAGACISPFVTFTSNIQIGQCFHANLYAYVEHDCVVGNFVTLAPGAQINGNVSIGDEAYIGAGAIIRQGLTIGARAVIGMGAVVTRDVPSDTTVIGNPARPIKDTT